MNSKSLIGKISLIALLAVATQSCKKDNSIDNENVIQKPYVVYASDANGNIFKTNNGDNYETVFPGDGSPLRALVTSKNNIIIVKGKTVFVSQNEGKAFNPIKGTLVEVPLNIKWPFFLMNNANLNRVYITNQFGISGKVSYSPENGTYYELDTNWNKEDTPYVVESFTYLENQILCGFSTSGSSFGITKLFFKTGKDESWKPRTTDLPSPFNFYLAHFGNTLIATDYDGVNGSWYSNDTGKTFKKYNGLPTGKVLYTTYSAYQKLLVGTQGSGVYLYDNSKFNPSNTGLPANTSVYSIVAKENYYKNDATKVFFYIATNNGIYRSEDLAKTWIRVKQGAHTLVN